MNSEFWYLVELGDYDKIPVHYNDRRFFIDVEGYGDYIKSLDDNGHVKSIMRRTISVMRVELPPYNLGQLSIFVDLEEGDLVHLELLGISLKKERRPNIIDALTLAYNTPGVPFHCDPQEPTIYD